MAYNFKTGSHSMESFLNYLFGIFMIVCFLVSTTMNPLIFYSYTKKSKSVLNFLFKVIAVTDFLTNLIPALFIAVVFLSPQWDFTYSFKTELPEFFSCTFGCISQVTTTLMAITRMISIVKPFVRVKFRFVLVYIIIYAIYMSIGNGGSLMIAYFKEQNYADDDLVALRVINTNLCFIGNVTHCFVGIACGAATVIYLRCTLAKITEYEKKVRSSYTILIMNIPYVISIITNVMSYFDVLGIDFKLVNHYLIPILTSAFNPCVIVTRSNVIRNLRKHRHRGGSLSTQVYSIRLKENGYKDNASSSPKSPAVIMENPSLTTLDTLTDRELNDLEWRDLGSIQEPANGRNGTSSCSDLTDRKVTSDSDTDNNT